MSISTSFLVLGGTGQIGRELCRHLAPSAPVLAPPRHVLDLADLGAVAAYIRANQPSVIFNAAAMTAVDLAEREPVAAYRLNAELPGVIGESAARIGAGVVHYSSDYVFNGMSDTPYLESDEAVPLNVYGATKLAGERALSATKAMSLTFRTSWVYGAQGSNFALTVRRKLSEGERLRVVDDQHGAPTWSRLIATESARCAALLGSDADLWHDRGGIYHLTASGETTWYGFASALGVIFYPDGNRPSIEPITSNEFRAAARRPRNSLLNSDRVERAFGVRMPSWQEQLGQAFSP
ncbi:MAG: dTDP-4-dehydrorhamnose reductase [bacterium]